MQKEFIPNLHFLQMKLIIIPIKRYKRFLSHNITCKIANKVIDDVIMDLSDWEWDQLVYGQAY